MITSIQNFKDVTLLVTHYNRGASLERLLKSFKDLNCHFEDIVVSDDGSREEHLNHVKSLQGTYSFRLITTPVNKGLGNNINKGQDAVKTPLTLYIQEDFTAKPSFIQHFTDALNIINEDKKVDMVTLYSYSPYPYLKPYKLGFSEKVYKPELWYANNLKFYLYGDHPHLRRSTFLSDFGRYEEGMNGDDTEMQMSLSFIKNGGKCLFYDDHYGLLHQENSEDEPSTATFRKSWTERDNGVIQLAKWAYSKIKFFKLNFQLLKKHKIKK